MGELCLARGKLEEARLRYHAVLNAVRPAHDVVGEAYAQLGLGLVAVRQGRPDPGEQHLRAGLRLAERIGERMAQGRLLVALAEMHSGAGRTIAAAAALAEALALFRALDATLWQARALDALGCLHADAGDRAGARSAWQAGLSMLDGVTSNTGPDLATRLRARLAD